MAMAREIMPPLTGFFTFSGSLPQFFWAGTSSCSEHQGFHRQDYFRTKALRALAKEDKVSAPWEMVLALTFCGLQATSQLSSRGSLWSSDLELGRRVVWPNVWKRHL